MPEEKKGFFSINGMTLLPEITMSSHLLALRHLFGCITPLELVCRVQAKRLFMFLVSGISLLLMLAPWQAAAQVGGVKKMTRDAVRSINALPIRQREAFLSEMYFFLFMEGDACPYEGTGSEQVQVKKRGVVQRTVEVPVRWVSRGARFVGSDGEMYDFYESGPHAGNGEPKMRDEWLEAKRCYHLAGKQNLRAPFSKVLEKLEVKRAVYLLQQMTPLARQALFAELLGLCYMEDGSEASVAMVDSELMGERLSHKVMELGSLFVDAEGEVHDFHLVSGTRHPDASYNRQCVRFCYLRGHKKMLQPFKDEIAAMKKHHASRVGTSQPAAPQGVAEATEAESHAAETDADKAAHYLKVLSRPQRETLLAEVAGLLFMEDGQSAYKGDVGYDDVEVKENGVVVERVAVRTQGVREQACFVGSDGRLYQFYTCLATVQSNPQALDAWKLAKLYIQRAGKPAVFAQFKAELNAMKKQRAARNRGR